MARDIIGEVVEILDESHVLLKLKRSAELKSNWTVFGKVPCPELKEKHGLDHFLLPKGELRITSDQGNYYYLAEIFKETTYVDITARTASLLSGAFRSQAIQGPPSAVLSQPTVPVKLEVTKAVRTGDLVGQG